MALLLPDPCDPQCPEEFKLSARKALSAVGVGRGEGDLELRRRLLNFISDFANWDNSAKSTWLHVGRSLVKAAHGEEPQLVVDPFAGGGSIPLEALRLGCDAFASDLNPVACLILKVMLEDIPHQGSALADELRKVGAEIKVRAEQGLADLYPRDPDGATPIAYLWARTVRCEAPNCGAEIPLMRSFWLCKKDERKKALRHSIERMVGVPPEVVFDVFEPKAESEVCAGTVTRAKATCLCCGTVLPPDRVRQQLATERGGADVKFDAYGNRIGGARMTAVVTLCPKKKGRHYRSPTDADYAAVRMAQRRVTRLLNEWERGGRQGLCPIPEEPLPPIGTLGFRVQRYGMLQWGDLFTARQKIVLAELARLLQTIPLSWRSPLAVALNRVADGSASLSSWLASGEEIKHVFARQALPIVWDFGESNYLADASRTWSSALISVEKVIDHASWNRHSGQIQQSDATAHPLPDQSAPVWFTDPPYYDAVPYADLSDFFLVWLKRSMPEFPLLQDPSDAANPLSPKLAEAVQDETKEQDGQRKDRAWFEEIMAKAFAEGRRVLAEDGIGSVVFAHKTTEGWEALLSGMVKGGWTITGSWPIATEMTSRLRARDSAALATSVHLICRPRPNDAPIGDWSSVLRELPLRVANWMKHLQQEGVRGADLVFACIGPALEVFSRYRAVETAEGQEIGLPRYLEKVWEIVGRAALEQVLGTVEVSAQNDMAGVLEEDARLTALFLWALQGTGKQDREAHAVDVQSRDPARPVAKEASTPPESDEEQEDAVSAATTKGFHLPYDVVRRFSQPMGIDLDEWTGRVISQKKGVVRLLPVVERSKMLFGTHGAERVADWVKTGTDFDGQKSLFPELDTEFRASRERRAWAPELDVDAILDSPDATVLDRVHAAMLLQAGGNANALRKLIAAEQERAPDFLRLSNALSALYPRGSREKRLLDAMLLAVPR